MITYKNITSFIRSVFHEPKEFIPLHDPRFLGTKKSTLMNVLIPILFQAWVNLLASLKQCVPNTPEPNMRLQP